MLKLLGYGLVTTATVAWNGWAMPMLFPATFAEERWTVGKHISWSLFQIGCIALGNTLYSHWLALVPFTGRSFGQFLFLTWAIGIFPSVSSHLRTTFAC